MLINRGNKNNNIIQTILKLISTTYLLYCRRREMTILSKPTTNLILGVSETELFLRNVREKYSSLPKKIQFAIDKFAARKDFENQQILNIQEMYKNKPGEDNNIEEKALLENALDSIGYFNLKSGSNFKMTENKIIKMEDSFENYMEVKDKVNFTLLKIFINSFLLFMLYNRYTL